MVHRREARDRGADTVVVDGELRWLMDAVLPGEAIHDRALAEAVVRVLGAVAALHDEHAPNERGRCRTCGRRPCHVQAVLSEHLSARPLVPTRPPLPDPPLLDHPFPGRPTAHPPLPLHPKPFLQTWPPTYAHPSHT